MKILFLANRSSSHATRWANELSNKGHEILYVSVINGDLHLNKSITYIKLKYNKPLGFIINVFQLRRIIKVFEPDILHVHYIIGNGLLGVLSGFKPLMLSVYGSDVLVFPDKSPIHKFFVCYILKKASLLCSTSEAMRIKILKLMNRGMTIPITPFGVDVNKFVRTKKDDSDEDRIVIGTIKKIEQVYGIDTLIKSFALLSKSGDVKGKKLELLIVGGGSKLEEMKMLVETLDIADLVTFTGRISHDKVVEYLNQIDVFVALSRSESFGVAVIEASACEIPVVVSNVGGLPEVVEQKHTGIIVPKEDENLAKEAILELVKSNELRRIYGRNGREKVKSIYNWDDNLKKMEQLYRELI